MPVPAAAGIHMSGIGVGATILTLGNVPVHVISHQAGGLDPISLPLIAGQLVAGQHPAGLGANLHHNQVHGAADHTDRTRIFPADIRSFGAILGAPALTQYVGGINSYIGWAFDPAADEYISGTCPLPGDWSSGGIVVTLYWTRNAGGAGNVYLGILLNSMSVGDTLQGVGAARSVTSAVPDVDLLAASVLASVGGVAAGDLIKLAVYRLGTNVADTYASDAILVGVKLEYTADM